DVARQNEVRERGQCDIVRASDAGFQHTATPDGNARGLSDIVNSLRFPETRDAAQLDIDDAARAQTNGLLGMVRGADAFIEADRGFQLRLKRGVVDDLVMRKRLFDHHQIEVVELFELSDVGERVGGVRIGHQLDRGETLPDPAYDINVPSRLDLHLDALIS